MYLIESIEKVTNPERDGVIMDWIKDLSKMEKLLKKDLERLNNIKGEDEDSKLLRSLLKKMIEIRVKGIDIVFNDFMCGRTSSEKDIMEYQARLSLPVFSHLKNLISIDK